MSDHLTVTLNTTLRKCYNVDARFLGNRLSYICAHAHYITSINGRRRDGGGDGSKASDIGRLTRITK